MEFAIVDIETTGGYASANSITEISIHIHNGQKTIDRFETLINPGQSIPYYIRGLTGITDKMVEKAPPFSKVAAKIFSLLENRVFIAHSVNFDYSFVKQQLADSGYELNVPKLCTIRLSRKIFPDRPSYSLGNLCGYMGIPINNRHRAGGDAEATVKLFELLLENDKECTVLKFVKRNSRERILPPNLPAEQFDKLPETPGVYYFYNQKGKPVYVGKANNIKKRVTSHFANNGTGPQKQDFMRSIYSIGCEECGNELMALILESHQIKQHWPAFNRSQKRFEATYGIFTYHDQNGFKRFCIEKVKKAYNPVSTFNSIEEGLGILRRLTNEFNLCLRLTGVATNATACADNNCTCQNTKQKDITAYNERAENALAKLTRTRTFVIAEKGRRDDEMGIVAVENGVFSKMGYMPIKDFSKAALPEVLPTLPSYKENFNIRQLITSYTYTHPENVILLG